MDSYVSDTHALFWYLTASPRPGTKAKGIFEQGEKGEGLIYVPAIVLAELYFLNEKLGRPLEFALEYHRLRNSGQFVFLPFVPGDTLDFDNDSSIPEMHDRIIVGAARRLGISCLSQDPEIVQSGLVATVCDLTEYSSPFGTPRSTFLIRPSSDF